MRLSLHLPLLALAALLSPATERAAAGEVVGSFRLEKATYAVGEPIVVEFTVANGGTADLSFFEGGDYRGTLRHDLYSFRVVNAAGRDFTQELWGNEGGMGLTITVKPGETFRSWQLLNGWTQLLPPGAYRVHGGRRLSPDPYAGEKRARPEESVTVEQDLSFEVTPYSKDRIVATLAAMNAEDGSRKKVGEVQFSGVPVGWAVADLNEKFQVGATYVGKEAEFEKAVLAALPDRWDDRLYLAYGFRENRNWLTPEKPEEFRLTFTVRNNGNAALPHGLEASSLSMNDVALPAWPDILEKMLKEKALGDTIEPGAVLEISGPFNDSLPSGRPAKFVWTVGTVTKSAEVRVGQ